MHKKRAIYVVSLILIFIAFSIALLLIYSNNDSMQISDKIGNNANSVSGNAVVSAPGDGCFYPDKGSFTIAQAKKFLSESGFSESDIKYALESSKLSGPLESKIAQMRAKSPENLKVFFDSLSSSEKTEIAVLEFLTNNFADYQHILIPGTKAMNTFYGVDFGYPSPENGINLHIIAPKDALGRVELYRDFLDAMITLHDQSDIIVNFKVTLNQRIMGDPSISSQAGKFITMYPKNPEEARVIAEYLDKRFKVREYGEGEPISSSGDIRLNQNSFVSWRYNYPSDNTASRNDPSVNLQSAASDPNIRNQEGMNYWFSNAVSNGYSVGGFVKDTPSLTLEQKAKEISKANSIDVEKEVLDFILVGEKLPSLTRSQQNELIDKVKRSVYIYDENDHPLAKYDELDEAIAGEVIGITPEKALELKNIVDGLFSELYQRDINPYEQEVLQHLTREFEYGSRSNVNFFLRISLKPDAHASFHFPVTNTGRIYNPKLDLNAYPTLGDSPFLEQLLHEGGHASDWIKKYVDNYALPDMVSLEPGIDNVHLIFYQEIRQLLREKNGNLVDAFDKYSYTYGPKNPAVISEGMIDYMTPIMDLAITSGKGNWDLYQILEFDNLLVKNYEGVAFYSIDTSSSQFKDIVDKIDQLNTESISFEKAKNIVEKEVITNGNFVKESDKPTQYIDPKTNKPYVDAKTGLVAPYYTGYMTGPDGVKIKVFIKAQHGNEVPATAAVSYKFAEKFFAGSDVLALPQIRRNILINNVPTDVVISPWKEGITDSMILVKQINPSDASLIRTFYMMVGDPAHTVGTTNSMNLFALKDGEGIVYGVVTDLNGGLNVISDIQSLPGIYQDFQTLDNGRINQDAFNRLSQFDKNTIDSIVRSENYDFTFPGIADLSITDEVIASFVDRVEQLKATYNYEVQTPLEIDSFRPQDVKIPELEEGNVLADPKVVKDLKDFFGKSYTGVVEFFAQTSKSKFVEGILQEEIKAQPDKIVNKYTLTFRSEEPITFYTKYDKYPQGINGEKGIGGEGYFTLIANHLGLGPVPRLFRDSTGAEIILTTEIKGTSLGKFTGTDAQLDYYIEQYGVALATFHHKGGIVLGKDIITPNSELAVDTRLNPDNNRVTEDGKPTFIDFEFSSVATKEIIEKEFNQVRKAIENQFGSEKAEKFTTRYQTEKAKYLGQTSTLADEVVAKRIELTFEDRIDVNVKFVSDGKYSKSNIAWYNYDVPALLKYADPNFVLTPKDSRVLEYKFMIREPGKDYLEKLTFYAKRRVDPRVQTNSLYSENQITEKAYLAGVGPKSRLERINFNEGAEEQVLITSDINGESIYETITRLKNAGDKTNMLKFIGDYGYSLGKLRKAGVVHRDLVHAVDANARSLHMGNAFMTPQGIKFIDFGQSSLAEVGDSSFEFERTDLITAMQTAFVGTGITPEQIRDAFNLRYSEGYSGVINIPKTESNDIQNSKQIVDKVVPGSNFEGYVSKVIKIDASLPPIMSVQKALKELNVDPKKYYYIRGVAPEEAKGALSLSNERTQGTGVFNSRDVRPAFGLNVRDKPGIDLVNLNTFLTESGPIARAADYANIGAFVENYVNYYGEMPDPALLSVAPTPEYTGYYLVFATDKPLPQDMATAIRPGVIVHYGSPDKVNIVSLPEGIEEQLVAVIPAFPMQPFKPLKYKEGLTAVNIVQKIEPCSGSFWEGGVSLSPEVSLSPAVGPCKVTLGRSNQLFLAQYDIAISNKNPTSYSIDDPRTISGFMTVKDTGRKEYNFVFPKGVPDFSNGQRNIKPFGLAHYKKHILPSQHIGYLSDLIDMNVPSPRSSLMLSVSLDANGLFVLTANSPEEVMGTFESMLSNGELSPYEDWRTGEIDVVGTSGDVFHVFRIIKTDSTTKKLTMYNDFQFVKSGENEYIFTTAYPIENPLDIYLEQFPNSVINYHKYNSASGRYEKTRVTPQKMESVIDQIYDYISKGKYRYSTDASGKTIIKPLDREFWSFLSLTKLIQFA